MKESIKNKETQGRKGYVPPSVKVINVAAQRVICISGENESYGHQEPNWFDD